MPGRTNIGRHGEVGVGMTFFEWLAAVCNELGWSVMRAHDLLDDPRWSDMFERGLTPTQAAAQARSTGLG